MAYTMEPRDYAGFAGDAAAFSGDPIDGFHAHDAMALAEDYASIADDLEAADEELFEDDLISLIARRPSRQSRAVAR